MQFYNCLDQCLYISLFNLSVLIDNTVENFIKTVHTFLETIHNFLQSADTKEITSTLLFHKLYKTKNKSNSISRKPISIYLRLAGYSAVNYLLSLPSFIHNFLAFLFSANN